jgi:hypothetical protein
MAKDHENDEAMTGTPDCICGQALDFPSQSTCAAWVFANVPVRSQESKRKTKASWEVIHITSIDDGRSKVVNEFLRDHETLADPFDHVPIFADLARRKTGRPSGRAIDAIRASHQSKKRKGARYRRTHVTPGATASRDRSGLAGDDNSQFTARARSVACLDGRNCAAEIL